LMSTASVAELGRQGGRDDPDARRFRMNIEIEGCERPHEEDEWIGRRVQVGEAVLNIPGPVPRCVITTQDPDTGIRDCDTLKTIKAYRDPPPGAPLDFGVYGVAEQPGRVRL